MFRGIWDKFTKSPTAAKAAATRRKENRQNDKGRDRAHESLRKKRKAYNRNVYDMTMGQNIANAKYKNAVNGFNNTQRYVIN